MTRPIIVHDQVAATARALADPTRASLLRLIQSAESPVGVRELTDKVSLHPNAVRQHLAALRDAGLVIEEKEARHSVGRPRLCYRPNPESEGRLGGWNPYEVLSLLLLEIAAGAVPVEVGREYGRRLAEQAAQPDPVDLFAIVAERHGFHPTIEREGDDVRGVLGRCPFAAAAATDPLVCELHRGIAEGITAGTAVEVVALEVKSPVEGGCTFHVGHPAGTHEGVGND